MKTLSPSPQLLQLFKSRPETLIFEGYCSYTDKVTIWNSGDSYALIADVDDVHKTCFFTQDMSFVDAVTDNLHGKTELCGVVPQITEHLRGKYRYEWETHCILHIWNGKPLPHRNICEIHPMSPKYAQIISDGTHYRPSLDEVRECLEIHPSAAVCIDGEPVCWCLCHREKSLGMLYTVPEYRHKGYALEVMTALCNAVIDKGDIPYAYIVSDNVASMNLAAKYNLVKAGRADYFLIVKD